MEATSLLFIWSWWRGGAGNYLFIFLTEDKLFYRISFFAVKHASLLNSWSEKSLSHTSTTSS